MRGFVDRILASEQCAAPGFEPLALRQHDKLGRGKFLAQRLKKGRIARHASDQQHAPQGGLSFLEERDNLAGHAFVQRLQDVSGRGFVAIELVRHIGFAMHRAARCQRDHLSRRREADRRVDVHPHPADQLHEEFTAAGRTLVVRQDIGYSSTGERIDQKRFAAQ